LLRETQFAEQSVPFLLALAQNLRDLQTNPIPFMRQIQAAHPEDYWANYCLGHVLLATGEYGDAIRFLQAAAALRPDAGAVYSMLGNGFYHLDRFDEATEQYRRALKLDPSPRSHRNLTFALAVRGPYDEAVQHGRLALHHFPDDALLHSKFGTALVGIGQHDDEALQHFEKAVVLDPNDTNAHMGLRHLHLRKGRAEEAFKAWGKALNSKSPPAGHQHWYGYAELCLFRGMETEYRRARHALLQHFSAATDPYIAERTGRACLLLPASGDELGRAAALAGRAATADPASYAPGALPYFHFVHGLAEYRQGRFEQAIGVLKGAASRMAGPSPRLVLAMAQHRAGQAADARQTLAFAIPTYDWRMNRVQDQDGWIAHILRQEAEQMIVPELSAFLSGKREPRDNIERLALIGACQSRNRTLALARLYTALFTADPNLAQDYRFGHRAKAACPSVLAGCGRGADAGKLGDSERARLRAQANEWLRADLTAWNKAFESDAAATRNVLKRMVTTWRSDPDLACVRDPEELAKLPPTECQEWLALRKDVDTLLARRGTQVALFRLAHRLVLPHVPPPRSVF
jgi:Flp pilus assembly protein TadD